MGNWFVVEEGLEVGEQVVTTGSFLLKTEILKGSIGAGCCEIEPAKR
jgi:cobalt-zinc-cadmium efflux system membrane fusion protein